MTSILTERQTVDIGGDRGRLAPEAARSLARVDAARGRPSDVNSAWRDPNLQQQLRDAYEAYLAGGPWAVIALPPSESIHCRGYAIDTDDHSPADVALWNEHGWFQTVYRNGRLVEPWHFEYDRTRDQHRNDPAAAPTQATTRRKEPDMILSVIPGKDRKDGATGPNAKKALYFLTGDKGLVLQWTGEGYARAIEKQIGGPAGVCGESVRRQAEARSTVKVDIVDIVDIDDE